MIKNPFKKKRRASFFGAAYLDPEIMAEIRENHRRMIRTITEHHEKIQAIKDLIDVIEENDELITLRKEEIKLLS